MLKLNRILVYVYYMIIFHIGFGFIYVVKCLSFDVI